MNTILLISSLLNGIIIHRSSQYKSYTLIECPYLVMITYLGIITSIANHGTNHPQFILIDRACMYLAFCIYLKYISSLRLLLPTHIKYNLYGMLFQTTTMYFISNGIPYPYVQTMVHCITHMTATTLYWRLLCATSSTQNQPHPP